MTLTISKVEAFSIGSLTRTGDGLSSGSESLADNATTVINQLDLASADWAGETQTRVEIQAKDHANRLQDRAGRWSDAAAVLHEAADQLGRLKAAITAIVDHMVVRMVCDVAEDGTATVKASYLTELAVSYMSDSAGLRDACAAAFAAAAAVTFKLRTLLNTMDVAAQYYDWTVENALLGLGRYPTPARPFVPRIPITPSPPTAPIEDANADGSGPDDYRTYDPNFWKKTYLHGIRAGVESGEVASHSGTPVASEMLRHFLDNSGSPYVLNVGKMQRDVPEFAEKRSGTRSCVLRGPQQSCQRAIVGQLLSRESGIRDQRTRFAQVLIIRITWLRWVPSHIRPVVCICRTRAPMARVPPR